MMIKSIPEARTIILATQWFHNMYRQTLEGTREMQTEAERYSSARAFLSQQGEDVSDLPLMLDSKLAQEVAA